MRRNASRVMLIGLIALLGPRVSFGQLAPVLVDPDGQVGRFMKVDVEKLLAEAPEPPARPEGLKLRLVDFIDCTNPRDPHPTLDDGLGRRTESPAGAYRETGPAAGSWFAYRFHIGGAGRPHVVILQFPDDEDRIVALSLSQAPTGDEAKPAARMEFGYRTGDLLPVSGKMLSRWTLFYPTGRAPAALLVASWHARARGALARAWICVVEDDKVPPAVLADQAASEAGATATAGRQAGRYDFDPRVVHTRFGGRVENLVQAMDYLGLSELSVNALQYRRFNYPSHRFATGGTEIPRLLEALAPAGKRLIAVFDPDCTAGIFSMPGEQENVADIGTKAARDAWFGFIDRDFLKSYGEQRILAGIMLGGPQGCAAFDIKADTGHTAFLAQLARHLARGYPQRLYQNLAAASPYSHYLRESNADWPAIARWELSEKSMDQCVTDQVLDYWRGYGLEEDQLAALDGLVLMRQCDRDDAACYRFAHHPVPRYWLFDAIAQSPGVTALVGGGKLTGLIAASTPARRMMLLRPGEFWWHYTEMAPTIPPAGPGYFAPLATALASAMEPHTVWLAGAGAADALHEEEVRHWMTTFRRLPFRSFTPLPGAPAYPAVVRAYTYANRQYLMVANPVAGTTRVALDFSASTGVEFLDGRSPRKVLKSLAIEMPPWGLRAFAIEADVSVTQVSQESPESEVVLLGRLEKYAADLEAAGKAGVAMPRRYEDALKTARQAAGRKEFAELDRLLNVAIVREPGFRLRVMKDRPRADVAAAAAVTIDGRLDDWAGVAPIRLAGVEHLACGEYAANHWKGPDDLSAELYLAWDRAGLYFALKVVDDAPTDDPNESSTLALSDEEYRSFSSRPAFDYVLHLPRAAERSGPNLVTRRGPGRGPGGFTVHEGLIPAAELPERLRPRAGHTIGLNLVVSDSDDRTAMPHPWCRSNVLAWSNRQDGYHVWTDAQTCGEITFK